MAVVGARYYTDPACPWSWGLEPALRRLSHEFSDQIEIEYVMCGMARQFEGLGGIAVECLEVAQETGMPVDVRLWLQDAPRSSHPACIAVKAAAEQGPPGAYLRRLREGFMCRARKLDGTEALVQEAREAGLDPQRFRIDLGSHAILEAFGADLERAGSVPVEHHAAGTGRVVLPSLEFRSPEGHVHGVYGHSPYEALRSAALAAGAQPAAGAPPGILDVLETQGGLATAEVAEVCRLPGPRAPAELWRLATEWRVRQERIGTGELWWSA